MNENNPNLTNFSQRMLGWSFCGAQPNTVTDPMPDLRDLYYSIEGCERLLSLVGLGRFGRRLGGGRRTSGGICQWP